MSVNPLLRICDFIFVLRPLILIPAWSFYLIGAATAIETNPDYPRGFPGLTAFLSLTAILITAYLLNQIFDRDLLDLASLGRRLVVREGTSAMVVVSDKEVEGFATEPLRRDHVVLLVPDDHHVFLFQALHLRDPAVEEITLVSC